MASRWLPVESRHEKIYQTNFFRNNKKINWEKTNVGWLDKVEITAITFTLPHYSNYPTGDYRTRFRGDMVEISVVEAQSETEDPFYPFANEIWYSTDFFKSDELPFTTFSDNRGVYPCRYAIVTFPRKIATWDGRDDEWIRKIGTDRIRAVGLPPDEDLVVAIMAFNKFFSFDGIITHSGKRTFRYFTYDEISTFKEEYFENSRTSVLVRIVLFLGRNSYLDALYDHYLGKSYEELISHSRVELTRLYTKGIASQEELTDFIAHYIVTILKHWIEDKRFGDAVFWKDSRKILDNGEEIKMPDEPKNEVGIQPILHLLFNQAFFQYGIVVLREPNEGVGSLDFKFVYTTMERRILTTIAEFKLAHHPKIKHGLKVQLPAYMTAEPEPIKSGIFIALWFKDEHSKAFGEPSGYSLDEFSGMLNQLSEELWDDKQLKIKTILIDTSKQPSASNRKE